MERGPGRPEYNRVSVNATMVVGVRVSGGDAAVAQDCDLGSGLMERTDHDH